MRNKHIPTEIIAHVDSRSMGICEGRVRAAGCIGRGAHHHHRQYRSRGGKHTVPNLIVLCLRCHEWVHCNGREAKDLGLAVGAYADPARIPVLYRGKEWKLLDDHGGVISTEVTEK